MIFERMKKMKKSTILIIAFALLVLYLGISILPIPYKGIIQLLLIVGIAIFLSKIIRKK